MSRCAESATPILFSSLSSSPLRLIALSSWRITRRLCTASIARSSLRCSRTGVTGRSSRSSTNGSRRSTSSPSSGSATAMRTTCAEPPARSQASIAVALGVEAPRVGEHQRRPPSVERGLEGRERAHLLGRRAGGQVAGEDLARFTPDEKVGHGLHEEGRAKRSTGAGPPVLRQPGARRGRAAGRSGGLARPPAAPRGGSPR